MVIKKIETQLVLQALQDIIMKYYELSSAPTLSFTVIDMSDEPMTINYNYLLCTCSVELVGKDGITGEVTVLNMDRGVEYEEHSGRPKSAWLKELADKLSFPGTSSLAVGEIEFSEVVGMSPSMEDCEYSAVPAGLTSLTFEQIKSRNQGKPPENEGQPTP